MHRKQLVARCFDLKWAGRLNAGDKRNRYEYRFGEAMVQRLEQMPSGRQDSAISCMRRLGQYCIGKGRHHFFRQDVYESCGHKCRETLDGYIELWLDCGAALDASSLVPGLMEVFNFEAAGNPTHEQHQKFIADQKARAALPRRKKSCRQILENSQPEFQKTSTISTQKDEHFEPINNINEVNKNTNQQAQHVAEPRTQQKNEDPVEQVGIPASGQKMAQERSDEARAYEARAQKFCRSSPPQQPSSPEPEPEPLKLDAYGRVMTVATSVAETQSGDAAYKHPRKPSKRVSAERAGREPQGLEGVTAANFTVYDFDPVDEHDVLCFLDTVGLGCDKLAEAFRCFSDADTTRGMMRYVIHRAADRMDKGTQNWRHAASYWAGAVRRQQHVLGVRSTRYAA